MTDCTLSRVSLTELSSLPALQLHSFTLGASFTKALRLATPHSFFWPEKDEEVCVQVICCTNSSTQRSTFFHPRLQMQRMEFQLVASQSVCALLRSASHQPTTKLHLEIKSNTFLKVKGWRCAHQSRIQDPRWKICPQKRIICLIGPLSKVQPV